MRKRDLPSVYHDLWDHLNDDRADALEIIQVSNLVQRVLPHLMRLSEVSPAAIVNLLDECRGMTAVAAADSIERFVLRDWHVIDPQLQALLDSADTVGQ